jgi:mannose/fructose-specific phosphotransferase system component IIA
MSEDGIQAVIIAHSSLASGLAAAACQISGVDRDVIKTISNEGLGPDALLALVRETIGDHPVVLFTDLASGSCSFAARKLSLDTPHVGIVTGVNLPILLDFVFHRDLPLAVLVDRLVEKGRTGISGAHTEEVTLANRAVSR